jgi:hypothetical protein
MGVKNARYASTLWQIYSGTAAVKEEFAYLKAVIEGDDLPQSWNEWFTAHSSNLERMLARGTFLKLKLNRIRAIPQILADNGIDFSVSDRYSWLGGVAGLCRDCGSPVERQGSFTWCPNGCFRLHVWRSTND